MELYQLESFLVVAEEQHLTRAAARLHISQPSVSAHIRVLEEELGLKLFIRTPKGMRLSPEGLRIRASAEAALQAAAAVRSQADRIKGEVRGKVRIGLNIDAHYLRASELLALLGQRHPGLEPHLHPRHTREAQTELKNGRLDAAFVFESPTNSGFGVCRLADCDIVIVAPYAWRSRLRNVSRRDLAGFPWIWTDDRCPFNRIISRLLGSRNRPPAKRLVVEDEATIRKMVAAGAGLGLMVGLEARDALKRKEVVICGQPVAMLPLSLLYLKERGNEPAIQALTEAVGAVWR